MEWNTLLLKCEKCFLNKPSVLLCEQSAFVDPSVIMKWEKWDTMDYSRCNLVGPGPLPLDPQQQQGIPLCLARGSKAKENLGKKVWPHYTLFQRFCTSIGRAVHTHPT